MRIVLLFIPLLATVTGSLVGNFTPEFFEINIDREHPEKLYKAFEDFIVKYKRNYKNDEEKKFRFNNFVKSYNKVDKLNEKAEKAGYDTKFGINKFSDWSSGEFSGALSHMPPPNRTDIPMLKMKDSFFRPANNSRVKRKSTKYPDSYDLRDFKVNGRYVVGPVKNQGNCACCWGFAVTGVMETVYAVNTGRFRSLSDQEVCDCGTTGTPGCSGGNLPMGVKYVSKYGLSSDQEYPFEENRAKKSRKCRVKSTDRVIRPGQVEYVSINPRRAEEEIIYVLTQWNIPVAVYFQVGDNFKNYERGVIVTDDCQSASEWHAGVIVGYGSVSDSRGRQHDYWTLKNSWDSDWGEDGYVRIARNTDWCSIEDSPITGDMAKH